MPENMMRIYYLLCGTTEHKNKGLSTVIILSAAINNQI